MHWSSDKKKGLVQEHHNKLFNFSFLGLSYQSLQCQDDDWHQIDTEDKGRKKCTTHKIKMQKVTLERLEVKNFQVNYHFKYFATNNSINKIYIALEWKKKKKKKIEHKVILEMWPAYSQF